MLQNNTVLIHGLPLRGEENGPDEYSLDGTLLPFVIEELIARSAVAISLSGNASDLTFYVPQELRKHVRGLDAEEARAYRRAAALLRPVTEEFGRGYGECGRLASPEDLSQPSKRSVTSLSGYKRLPQPLEEAIVDLFFSMPVFFLGLDEQMQVDLNASMLRDTLRLIRCETRGQTARIVLASLEGIFNTYRQNAVNGLTASAASTDLVDCFLALVEDREYQELSAYASELGIPERAKRALVLIKRGCKSILLRKPFRQLFTLGTRAIETATQIPLPDSEAAEQLLCKGYLPPFVPVSSAIKEAVRAWERNNPDKPHRWTPPMY